MSGTQPRAFDDHARLFALAHMHGYPVALAWNEDGWGARPAGAGRRSALRRVRERFRASGRARSRAAAVRVLARRRSGGVGDAESG